MKILDFQTVYFRQISYEKLWFFSAEQRLHHLSQQHWSSFEAVKGKSELGWRRYMYGAHVVDCSRFVSHHWISITDRTTTLFFFLCLLVFPRRTDIRLSINLSQRLNAWTPSQTLSTAYSGSSPLIFSNLEEVAILLCFQNNKNWTSNSLISYKHI